MAKIQIHDRDEKELSFAASLYFPAITTAVLVGAIALIAYIIFHQDDLQPFNWRAFGVFYGIIWTTKLVVHVLLKHSLLLRIVASKLNDACAFPARSYGNNRFLQLEQRHRFFQLPYRICWLSLGFDGLIFLPIYLQGFDAVSLMLCIFSIWVVPGTAEQRFRWIFSRILTVVFVLPSGIITWSIARLTLQLVSYYVEKLADRYPSLKPQTDEDESTPLKNPQ